LNPIDPRSERRRRLLTRAFPVVLIGGVAFAAGAVTGNVNELIAAERFAEAWEQRDFEAMHAELTEDSAERYPQPEFADAYRGAQTTVTSRTVTVDDVTEGEPPDGGDAAVLPVAFTSRAFGEVGGDLVLPLADGSVEWAPHLVYPGLGPNERLDRRTRAPERAPILARDGTPLAEGPASARSSPLGAAALSVAGEMGTPKPAQAETLEARGFPAGMLAGASGLELAFNDYLMGDPGGQLLAVGGGRGERVLAETEPRPGKPLRTTIDPRLQEAAVSALGGLFGGVAVLDPSSGQVLAFAGLAYSAPQPPGSTFKIITTTAALDADVVELSDTFPVVQSAVVGGREIANAGDEFCGGTFAESFAHSCNSVFAPLGAELSSRQLVGAAERFGFNEPPSLFNAEAREAVDAPMSTLPMSIPSELDRGVSAIGQGEVQATPLELASISQTIANQGVREPTAMVTNQRLGPEAESVRVTSRQTADVVRDLMVKVVNEGTGTAAALPTVQVAGKTGTAELGPAPLDPASGEEQEVDAWFTAFAPAEDPQLAVAVMVVNAGGSGGEIAAPIAREVLDAAL
jgi:peptidoglycan glycosyltransferase